MEKDSPPMNAADELIQQPESITRPRPQKTPLSAVEVVSLMAVYALAAAALYMVFILPLMELFR
jgi:hypothetical protein